MPASGNPVAVGVAIITAVAGVVLAAGLGGILLYGQRMNFKHRKRRRLPLTQKQWHDAFEIRNGHLVNVKKLVKNIRNGGIEPSIRTHVWPFLLGLYHLESTHAEREAERACKKKEFDHLRRQCILLVEKTFSQSRQAEEAENGFVDINPIKTQHYLTSISPERQKEGLEGLSCSVSCRNDETKFVIPKNESSLYDPDTSVRGDKGWRLDSGPVIWDDSFCSGGGTVQAMEEFTTWQRIIRLDAVRMNAEWVPYSPFQANVNKETASELARAVRLRDDEHLEPCRQHHAARLVAILEAYAMYDPETGYCQGMSDLLSPFVALLDDDYEAFWCFVHFMCTARDNFRLDETGIRRQLSKVSKILKLSDPHLYHHLEKINAEDCTFVYRMIVVLLRRELSFEQTICLWEVIWADKTAVKWGKTKSSWRKKRRKPPPSDDLLLYVIAAAIRGKRKFIMEKCRGMDDVLRECNAMGGHLDVWALLDDARDLLIALCHKIGN